MKRHKFKVGQRVQINATRGQLDSIHLDIAPARNVFIDAKAGHWENDTKLRSGSPTYSIDGDLIPECYLCKPKDLKPR